VAVNDRNTNSWLRADGTWGAWQQHNATLGSPGSTTSTWSYPFTAPGDGLYGVQVEATDTAGNTSPRTWVPFEVRQPDVTAPTIAISTPIRDQVFRTLSPSFSGSASDNRGIAAVRVAVLDRNTNTWLRPDGTWGAWQQHNATLGSPGSASSTWSYLFNAPRGGLYTVQVEAVDPAGNISSRKSVPFEVRLSKPKPGSRS
jgi:hypothetical protein